MATYLVTPSQRVLTLAEYKAVGQAFGAALSSFGWSTQSGHGEVVASGSGGSYAWTNVATAPTTLLNAMNTYNFRGAWAGGTSYTGSNTTNSTADLVTNGGLTFVCISNTAYVLSAVSMSGSTATITGTFANGGSNALAGLSVVITGFVNSGNNATLTITASTTTTITATNASGVNETHAGTATLNTAPASDTLHFQPYNYEIWKSNGANSSVAPIYVRVVFTCNGNANPIPGWHLSVGTGVDANGQLTGTMSISNTNPLHTVNIGMAAPTAGSTSTADLAFSGDADNFRCHFFRGGTLGFCNTFVIDRAKTQAGQDSDAFIYAAGIFFSAATPLNRSSIFLKTALGGTIVGATANTGWLGAVHNGLLSGLTLFGSNPCFPIFPIVGFVSNPLLGVVGINGTDISDGSILPFWMYGAQHNYLCSTAARPASVQATLTSISISGPSPAILFE